MRDLNELRKHVIESKTIVLLQSKHVLTRPFCLIELITAIDEGVPIVGVCMCNCGSTGYAFDEAADLLQHLDTKLAELNPYAIPCLNEFGVTDLEEVRRAAVGAQPASCRFSSTHPRAPVAACGGVEPPVGSTARAPVRLWGPASINSTAPPDRQASMAPQCAAHAAP